MALTCVVAPAMSPLAWAAADPDLATAVLAKVGGEIITAEEYRLAVHAGMRQKFFHGRVPEEKLRAFREEVAHSMIDRVLVLQEARRREMQADARWVDQKVAEIEARYSDRPDWRKNRDQWVAGLRRELEAQSIVDQLRAQVENVARPDRDTVRAYYRAHEEKFTTPERQRVSLILLKVEPWSKAPVWRAAEEEAQRLVGQLRGGADFAELAKLHSADGSAEHGGDLGYVHRGMFSEEAQAAIDALTPSGISNPVRLLQGFAVFRLEERIAPKLNPFEEAADRAEALWVRERKAQAWQDLLENLRTHTAIEVNETVISAAD